MNMDFLLSEQGLPALIIVLSPVGAFIIDLLFRFVFKRFAGKTKNTFDDAITFKPKAKSPRNKSRRLKKKRR